MKCIPFDIFEINSTLSESELKSKLSNQIERKVFFRTGHYFSDKEYKPYEGKIKENSFKINRIIKHQNSFLPIITGKIKSKKGKESKIKIIIRLHYLLYLFMFFWSFGPLIFFYSFWVEGENLKPKIIISILWVLLGYFGTCALFRTERNKSKKFLFKLFENEE